MGSQAGHIAKVHTHTEPTGCLRVEKEKAPRWRYDAMRIVLLGIVFAVTSCAVEEVTRSDVTLDSGRPLSDGLDAYDVEHYSLRNDVQVEKRSIAGSAAIRFTAVRDMSTLELDFDGLLTIDRIEDAAGPSRRNRPRVPGHEVMGRGS